MSAEAIVLIVAGALLLVTVVSGRLHRAWLSEPLLATALGVLAGLTIIDPLELESPAVLTILELTLALVLFSDASRIDVARLQDGFPARHQRYPDVPLAGRSRDGRGHARDG